MLIRFAIALAVSLMTSAVLFAADPADKSETTDKTSTENSNEASALADEIAEINEAHTEESRKFMESSRRFSRFQAEKKQRLLDIVKENANDPAAMDAVMLLVEKFRAPLDNNLLQQILASQLSNPKAGDVCLKLCRPNQQMAAQEDFLRQMAEKHEDEKARGLANFALGEYCRRMAQTNENDSAKQAQYLAEAEKCLTKVKNDFASVASVVYNRSTIGEKTDNELLRVRNLPNLKVGKMAPDIEGVDIDGQPLKLSDSRGKVTVLIFWGSWCGPCMALVPHEKELFERMKDKPFAMVSVDCGDTRDKAQETRKTKEMAWPCWWDGGTTDGPIQAMYNVPHYPRIFIIDAKGMIRDIDVRHQKLDEAVDKLIEEMDAGKMARR